jgi:nitronate monooxygenase
MFQNLLVPLDGTELSERAAQMSLDLAKKLGAHITGFVAEPLPPLPNMGSHSASYARQSDEHLARTEAHAQAAHQERDVAVQVAAAGAALNGGAGAVDSPLAQRLAASGLRALQLGGRSLLPMVQGGMGVGVSAHRLAGAVAALGGVGTILSVDLRRHHPDLMERTHGLDMGQADHARKTIDDANLEAIEREIRGRARTCRRPRPAGHQRDARREPTYAATVKRALEAGIDAVVVGAGLPLDLPDLAQDHPRAALIPILSDARGVQLIVKKWERKKRLPDAIVIEHPRLAGGHLGAAKIADLNDPRFDFENVIPQALAFLRSRRASKREVPLIRGRRHPQL